MDTDKNEWHLLDQAFEQISVLPAATSHFKFILNEPGSASLEIPMDSYSATLVNTGMFARANYRGAPRGGFFIDNVKRDFVSKSNEDGGLWMKMSGSGELVILEDGIVYPDNTGESTRKFTGTRAGVLVDIVSEAQARGALANLVLSFDAVDDTNNVGWTDSEPFDIEAGVTILEVVRRMAKQGIDFNMSVSGDTFTLNAYSTPIGTNKASTVFFRNGTNCRVIGFDERGGQLKNAIMGAYQRGVVVVKDTPSVTAYRRREKFLNIKDAQSGEAATTYMSAILSGTKAPEISIQVEVYDGVAPHIFLDYVIGDTVSIDIDGVIVSFRLLAAQCDWDGANYSNVILELNSLKLEYTLKMAQDLEWLMSQWNTARDASLLEVQYWAAIGIPNTTLGSVDMKVVGDYLYLISNTKLWRYDIENGGWTTLFVHTSAITTLEVIGTDVYVSVSNVLYKVVGSSLVNLGSVTFSGTPSIKDLVAIGTKIYVIGTYTGISVPPSFTLSSEMAYYDTSDDTWYDTLGVRGYLGTTDGTDLYVAGTDTGVSGRLRKLSSGVWSNVGGTFPLTISAIHATPTKVLIGVTEAGSDNKLYILNGSTWDVLGGGVNGVVRGITTYLDDVYVGGEFTDRGNYVAKYSGEQWWDMAGGTNGSVNLIQMYNDDVIVDGSFTEAGDKTALNVAMYLNSFESITDYLEHSSGAGFNLGEAIHNATAKTTLDTADEMPLWDSITQQLRKITVANIITFLNGLYVKLTGNQTVDGIKTFTSFPVTPSSAPTADYQVANKKYVDDNAGGGGGTPGGSDTEVQFNDGGVFGGEAEFTFDKTTGLLQVGPAARGIRFYGTDGDIVQYAPDGENPSHNQHAWGVGVPALISHVANGTLASQTAIQTAKVLWQVIANAFNGTDFKYAGRIKAVATENHNGTSSGMKWEVYCTSNGTNTEVLVATFDQDGNIDIASGKEYRVNGSQHPHVISDITDLTGLVTFETNANALFRCDSPGGNSTFLGTIATLPGGATLTYNVTSGNEGAMVPQSTSQLGKMRLYNTTRGTSALISNCVTGTNTITLTANVPAGWAITDVITIASQTVDGSASSVFYVDIEITSGPTGKTGLFINMGINGSAASEALRLHPLETFALSKQVNLFANVAGVQSVRLGMVKITSNVFSMAWSGTPTVVQLFESGYIS